MLVIVSSFHSAAPRSARMSMQIGKENPISIAFGIERNSAMDRGDLANLSAFRRLRRQGSNITAGAGASAALVSATFYDGVVAAAVVLAMSLGLLAPKLLLDGLSERAKRVRP
jgi:hypothetical protein